jgi:hypothetical protein
MVASERPSVSKALGSLAGAPESSSFRRDTRNFQGRRGFWLDVRGSKNRGLVLTEGLCILKKKNWPKKRGGIDNESDRGYRGQHLDGETS